MQAPPMEDNKAPRAVAAVKRLLPAHAEDTSARAKSMGGSNGQTYRVDAGEVSYFVRVLPDGYEHNEWNRRFTASLVTNTIAMGEAGVTPTVLASDEHAIVQQFIPSARVETNEWRNTLEDHAEARKFGAVIASVHSVPYPDARAPLAPRRVELNWFDDTSMGGRSKAVSWRWGVSDLGDLDER